jgi:ATP-dependent helicase/nuclease subunit B
VQARFLIGPAGSGKTFGCLAKIRAALSAEPEGAPLLLLAPKQTTYQLERQLLGDPSVSGYTRLHILSFERLVLFLFDRLGKSPPQLLDEEGRLMALRSLLARKRDRAELKLFRASARLTGFAQQLSLALRELQRGRLTPDALDQLAERAGAPEGLKLKLRDLAAMLREYLGWLAERGLQDADCLLDFATQALGAPHRPLRFGGLWLDGFTQLAQQELDLLAAVLPLCERATLTFCMDCVPTEKISSLSPWSVVRQAFHHCRERIARLPDCDLVTELLPRDPRRTRYARNPVLQHLEKNWAEPKTFEEPAEGHRAGASNPPSLKETIRVAICANPEAEATLAAREIIRFARAGGRYREATVLVRQLANYHQTLANVFARYEIPFFLDRRESVSHHPLAELTRGALRTVASQWMGDDWFAALKTGLASAEDADIDRLENEALARGWKGTTWWQPIRIDDSPELAEWVERLRRRIVPPFQKLALRMETQGNKPTGEQLAEGIRELWSALDVAKKLERWSAEEAAPIHLTIWEQMEGWLENVEMAFSSEKLSLREWLPILEAGLAGLTAGVIPPALDQVLIGAIDRSRNPEIRLALTLGMNEGVFPAPPEASVLLTDADREELENQGVVLGANARQQLGLERFYGYLACTRARERLVLACARHDRDGSPLSPSPFLARVRQLFPALEFETAPEMPDWRQSEHPNELIPMLLANQVQSSKFKVQSSPALNDLPALAPLRERLRHFQPAPEEESLSPELAGRLYGPVLRTSVSRMEQFAACPFKFFVHSGLRAEERKLFEVDIRDQGSFQHEVLAFFHEQLRRENKRWRDITPPEARERIRKISTAMITSYREGLLQASEESRFTARVLTESLEDFIETLVEWMRRQYEFDPVAVELPFGGEESGAPAWEIELGGGHRLALHGRIDRVDLCRDADGGAALCVVVDYKSSQKQLDSLLMQHGLQLQLPAYLNVLRHWRDPKSIFGAERLVPAGVFYVNLRGKYDREDNRNDALADVEQARLRAYRHAGRFDAGVLRKLDRSGATQGDQFNYRLTKNGKISQTSREALDTADFEALLNHVETALQEMGRAVFAGEAKVDPYRKGPITACEQCDYLSICRLDPWTHNYRILKQPEKAPSTAKDDR